MKMIKGLLAVLALSVTVGTANAADDTELEALRTTLEARLGGQVDELSPSPIDGLYQIKAGAMVLYVSADGNYLVQGQMFDLVNQVNLTEQAMNGDRAALLAPFADDVIEYKADDEKYVITVFTDTTCGYCQLLHSQLREYEHVDQETKVKSMQKGYNDLGITVRYLAFPRHGLNSPSHKTLSNIWCAEDPLDAMTRAKNRQSVPNASCDDNVAAQYELGQQLGIRGTPAMILEDGTMLPGYRAPADLLKMLQQG
ncbi:thioredoxin fold domain-containing protein [Aliagarivorans marinus]|uniref:thioredoxin fold domain-containing protein n=1 Tax=Aliagarivorans marinus TaxID=561965 RepID=UPI0003FA4BD2|nr:thioredoxin fold domain-containing protein [Aliagarivorans marinus]